MFVETKPKTMSIFPFILLIILSIQVITFSQTDAQNKSDVDVKNKKKINLDQYENENLNNHRIGIINNKKESNHKIIKQINSIDQITSDSLKNIEEKKSSVDNSGINSPITLSLQGLSAMQTTIETPFSIDGNIQFDLLKASKGWAGDGSSGNPILIDINITVSGNTETLVNISNTNYHFKIINSIFVNGNTAIKLLNVSHVDISNVTFISNSEYGINLANSDNINIFNNTFSATKRAIFFSFINDSLIYENDILSSTFSGISLQNSYNTSIHNNNVISTSFYAIDLYISSNNRIFDNNVTTSSVGIRLDFSSSKNMVYRNYIASASQQGMEINMAASSNSIALNEIKNNKYGILFQSEWSTNEIKRNNITSNTLYGVISYNTTNQKFRSNRFINNNGGSVQVSEEASNDFNFNMWSTWLGPDTDGDKIVDTPYSIDGISSDNYPLAEYVIARNPITIFGDSDFLAFAEKEFLPGNGSSNNPFIIDNYLIFNSTYPSLVFIRDTNYYFSIQNSSFSGLNNLTTGSIGINLYNLTNGFIKNNIIKDVTNKGIIVQTGSNVHISGNEIFQVTTSAIYLGASSTNVVVNNNTLYNSQIGVSISSSNNNTIANNSIHDLSANGLELSSSNFNNITSNNLVNIQNQGVYLGSSGNNNIISNLISNTISQFGIYLTYSGTNNIISNSIFNTTGQSGLYLFSSLNNNIADNTISYSALYAISLELSHNNSIVNNFAYQNKDALSLYSSNSSLIKYNIFHNNYDHGIFSDYSGNNLFEANTIYGNGINGINLQNDADASIVKNNLYNQSNNGILLSNSSNSNINMNQIFDNTGDGIYLSNCDNITLLENNITLQVKNGLTLYQTLNSKILSNIISNNQNGIYSNDSTFNFVSNNSILSNGVFGFEFDGQSDNNNIVNNLFFDNSDYAVYFKTNSDSNIIQANKFADNKIGASSQAYDIGSNNTFTNNFWKEWFWPDTNEDYIVDQAYSINGGANTDGSPAISQFITYLFDLSFYDNETRSLLWVVTDPVSYTLYRNGVIINQSTTSSIISLTILPFSYSSGLYNITLVVKDSKGFTIIDELSLTITRAPDFDPPTVSSPADLQFEEGSIGYSIIWSASDAHPWWVSVSNGTDVLVNKSWIGNDIIFSLDGYPAGIYTFNVTLYDDSGNHVSDVVIVSIYPQQPDNTAPIISSVDTFEFAEESTGNLLIWNITENHPLAYKIEVNGTEIILGPWHGENISYSVDYLTEGIWYVNLTLWDLSNNSSFKLIVVTVLPPPPDTIAPTISKPADIYVAENSTGIIIWAVDDLKPGNYTLYRNGTIIKQALWSSGVFQYQFSQLSVGTWNFTLLIFDTSGNSNSTAALVIVVPKDLFDNDAPVISTVTDKTIPFGSTQNTIKVYLFDANPSKYYVKINNVTYAEYKWNDVNIQLNISFDGFTIGEYIVNITAVDVYGNTAYRVFKVTITGDSTAPTISSPPDITVKYGTLTNDSITWVVSDANPKSYQILLMPSKSILASGTWDGKSISYSISDLEPGNYTIRLIVYDENNNYALDDVFVVITGSVGSQSTPGFLFPLFLVLFISLAIVRKSKNNRRIK